ncbi:MAG: transcriptional repressor [Spirochaetota bacterium]|nr:transcriptional repressor [Spirochaetota bacterium]
MKKKIADILDKIETFKKISKYLGLKITHQRLEIFKILVSMEYHPSAEEVYEAIREKIPSISFDTVYRTLALFESHGVIAKVQYLDDRTRYDSNMEPHYHLVCKKCRNIQDFYWPDLDQLKPPEKTKGWGEIDNKYLELRGICRKCLASRNNK